MPELRQNSRNIKCYNKIGIQPDKNAKAKRKQRAQLLSETGKKRIMEIGFLFCQFRKEGKVAGEKREAGKDTKKTLKMTEREIRGDSSHLEDQVMKTAALFFWGRFASLCGSRRKNCRNCPNRANPFGSKTDGGGF